MDHPTGRVYGGVRLLGFFESLRLTTRRCVLRDSLDGERVLAPAQGTRNWQGEALYSLVFPVVRDLPSMGTKAP
jgi:hypothetical protein